MFLRSGVYTIVLLLLSFSLPAILDAQELRSSNEIPIERCDLLPVVKVRIDGADMRFLLDTGATTMLNLKSFSSGPFQEYSCDFLERNRGHQRARGFTS